MKKWKFVLSVAALLGVAAPAGGQMYFGQNQVQYEHFKWQVWETEHFYVHYYPEMADAALIAAQMAERAYARLSKVLDHQFREKKPLILFSSRGHFGQNHVVGDLGEGTGGVTEGLRHRVLLPFTGDYHSFERVLTHELVHSFQYDIFARGRAGGGLALLQQTAPPLWFMEGMAEYLSLGKDHALTDAWMRDAAINGRLPNMQQLNDPYEFFPYRYGESLFQYIGSRWGDESIGRLLRAIPGLGAERAIQRELGITAYDLGEEWRDALQVRHLPDLPNRDRPRRFATPLLSTARTGGATELFLAPALSSDGTRIAFVSRGSIARGEVFMDLWLGDARTGKRIKRLVKSVMNPDYEELRLLYSQSSFSPDGKYLAFTAQREGRDVLYLMDVDRGRTVRRFDFPQIDVVMSPAFSPDGNRIVFSGSYGGTSDLYVVNTDNTGFERLTDDGYGDLQPQWSPDGQFIVFASERGPNTDFSVLKFGKWQISVLDLNSRQIEVIPGQGGLNINPMWAPDGKSVAFLSDRTGTANIFLYDFEVKEHYQLTDVMGSINAITEFSPALTWARGADVLAFTYFDNGDYTVWSVENPRGLRRLPFREESVRRIVAFSDQLGSRAGSGAAALQDVPNTSASDSTTSSFYRGVDYVRKSDEAAALGSSRQAVTVAELANDPAASLPDTSRFRNYEYKGTLEPEYISRPSIGYQPDSYGQGVYGQSVLILSDMLGNHQMALAGGLNGRISDAQFFGAYSNLSRRFQYMAGLSMDPYFYSNGSTVQELGSGVLLQEERLSRYIFRSAFSVAQYPFSRFSRMEFGLNYSHVDRSTMVLAREIVPDLGVASQWYIDRVVNEPGVSFVQPMVAYVHDNSLFGMTGPIMGTRLRAQVEPAVGGLRWVSYMLDLRRYEPIVFNYITIATRLNTRIAAGRDEDVLPVYIGNPNVMRGYNRSTFNQGCQFDDISNPSCEASRLVGSRIAVFNAEVRFPLVRAFQLGVIPISLPPIDGNVFYDAGMAWSGGDNVRLFDKMTPAEQAVTRFPLRSYGYGIRLNLYNLALLRWDYAIPLDLARRKGFWTFSIGQSF